MTQDALQKNWLQRYWKWFIPVIILLVAIPILLSPLGKSSKDFGSLYLNPSIYEDALAKVKQHKEAIELLGEPIETLFLLEGEVMYSDNGNSAKMTIPIKGSKTKGRMDIEADKVNGEWKYSVIRVRTKKPIKSIDIIH